MTDLFQMPDLAWCCGCPRTERGYLTVRHGLRYNNSVLTFVMIHPLMEPFHLVSVKGSLCHRRKMQQYRDNRLNGMTHAFLLEWLTAIERTRHKPLGSGGREHLYKESCIVTCPNVITDKLISERSWPWGQHPCGL